MHGSPLSGPTVSDADRLPHAELTASIPRRTAERKDAEIFSIQQITPTVKLFRLCTSGGLLQFAPGQWVDFYAPNVPQVGGYSICSPPSQMLRCSTLDLAVKQSTYPPAIWLHEQERPGAKVKLQVGGDFFLSPTDLGHPLLFIAGGIGITPIASMLAYLADHEASVEDAESEDSQGTEGVTAVLLYSASTLDELALREQLLHIAERMRGRLQVQFFATKEAERTESGKVYGRRINKDDVSAAFKALGQRNASTAKVFLCGPPSMVDDVTDQLSSLGIAKDDVKYEKWW
ncbi:Oxidoreductase NAD-binding domain-containing protein 1 [Coccomyxa sp. Obi]|nr:Oxidoreductase NAD-binding domain-containing protein 1 [Coccomyxa sp. Obi]